MRVKCMYGITKLAEEKGELNYDCESPVTRNMTSLLDMMVIELCESHYQECLVWDEK